MHAYKNPEYNWDILPYMAVIKNYEHKNVAIHDSVYSIAKNEIHRQAFKNFADSTNVYRWRAAQDTAFFNSQLEFYQVKPLYTGLAFLFFKTGFPLTKSTVLPSIFAYFLSGMLLFFWLGRYLKTQYTVSTGLLLMLSAPLMQAVRLSTLDSIATLFVLSSIYWLIEKKSVVVCYTFMLLAILTRIDNILPCLFILSALVFTNKWTSKLAWRDYFLMMAGALVCFVLTPYIFSSHSLRVASFFEHLKPFSDRSAGFKMNDYISLAKSQMATGLYYSSLLLFLFLALLLFVDGRFKLNRLNSDQVLVLMFFLIIAFRFILQPVISDRFYIPYYLCIAILLAKKIAVKTYP